MTFGDPIPLTVIETLAQVHCHFASRLQQSGQLPTLPRVDAPFFRRTFENALEALENAKLHSVSTVSQKGLEEIYRSKFFETVLDRLPVTLVHGDVHPGNIIHSPGGQSVLIDWGNVRIAPAVLDLANIVSIGSDYWQAYFAAWEKAGGPPPDPTLIRQAYYWAVAMVNLQFLPFAAVHWNENVPRMIELILDARDHLIL